MSAGQGEVVEVLRKDSAGETGFAFIRTANNTEGFVRSELLQSANVETKNAEPRFHKKQNSSDVSIAAHPNLCNKYSFASVSHANTEMTDTIDCSPAQVVPDHSTIFAHCCQTL